jgi:hypothetical protein
LRAVGVLRLPANQARPRGQQRLVDDFDSLPPHAFVLALFVSRDQPRDDECIQHGLSSRPGVGARRAVEDRQQLVAFAHGPRALGGHEVAEHLPHDRDPFLADPLECRFGVLRQRTLHAADVAIRHPGEQAALPIALVPEP